MQQQKNVGKIITNSKIISLSFATFAQHSTQTNFFRARNLKLFHLFSPSSSLWLSVVSNMCTHITKKAEEWMEMKLRHTINNKSTVTSIWHYRNAEEQMKWREAMEKFAALPVICNDHKCFMTTLPLLKNWKLSNCVVYTTLKRHKLLIAHSFNMHSLTAFMAD